MWQSFGKPWLSSVLQRSLISTITLSRTMVKVAVLGAGAVGLCSALNVQRTLPHAQVTVVADRFDEDTTSSGAGGIFRVYGIGDLRAEGVSRERLKQWLKDSWQFYHSLATSPEAKDSGAVLVTGTVAYSEPKDEEYEIMKELAIDFHKLSASDMEKFKLSHRFSHGYRFTTVLTESLPLLKWLMRSFKSAGGTVQRRTVKNLSELSSEYDIVVNCCGLRSGEVAGDHSSFPVKGHLVYLEAPWIRDFFMSDEQELIHYLPHRDKVVVGGIKEVGNYDLTPDPAVRQRILHNIETLFPQLKGAKVIGEWCGLRPGRSALRLGPEMVDCGNGRKLPVVHNYGHGGRGVFMGWGCGAQAAKHVQEIAKSLASRL